jgi:hypothetical protein
VTPPTPQMNQSRQSAIERALLQEAYLAQALLCAGMTSIRRTSHGSPGRMYEAFFGLSYGNERLAKLTLAANEYARTEAFPDPEELKRKGHDLKKLIRAVEDVSAQNGRDHSYAPSQNGGSKAVIAFLTKFANADRYYNINRLAQGDSATIDDPVRRWVDLVRTQTAARSHGVRRVDEANLAAARYLDSTVPLAIISGHSLDGQSHLSTFESLAAQGHEDERLAVEGMLLAVRPIRYLTTTISALDQARYPLPMFSEIFIEWTFPDSSLRRRKQFPLGR